MPKTKESKAADTAPGAMIPTAGVPTVYANIASLSISQLDIRVYLMDAQPQEISANQVARNSQVAFTPKLCLVVTPEFGKSLVQALTATLDKYEGQFGKIRAGLTTTTKETKTNGKTSR